MEAEPIPSDNAPVGTADLEVQLEGFAGPIDLLLHLAREQKVDLAKISILKLAEQYIAYIDAAHDLRLEVAADYLVMGAWLAYLKSRMLLPKHEQPKDEPTADELAAALAWQLKRLEAMQKASASLMTLPQVNVNVFLRGQPDGIIQLRKHKVEAELFDLLSAYGSIKKRTTPAPQLRMAPMELFSIEEATLRLREMLGHVPDWTTLEHFLPLNDRSTVRGRSALASTLIATLELAKSGLIQVRQEERYGPIYLRRQENPIEVANDQ
jgi:segregation and condensation protein A